MGGEGELLVVQGVVGRVPGGTGVGRESSWWYRVWLGEFPVVQGWGGRVPGGTGVRK